MVLQMKERSLGRANGYVESNVPLVPCRCGKNVRILRITDEPTAESTYQTPRHFYQIICTRCWTATLEYQMQELLERDWNAWYRPTIMKLLRHWWWRLTYKEQP